ncbi:MAG: ribosome biogenesis GTPase Der [Planctomycetes bacterium]|nr:ribosome biogenesis GTPase Der [Planctomycetota bacterium]MBL7039375.1 ribosome biogenesis GTPase Der [Pirellulaceae bacterium]
MSNPQVVIIGRPNVGKSSVFNWLAGRRLAIVDDVAGVTRDRMTHTIEHDDRQFELVDTGGIGINDIDDLTTEIEEQIAIAMSEADVILFVVDVRSGLASLDEEVARRLRGIEKPVIFVANKTDADTLDSLADEFYRLGVKDILRVSAKQNRNKGQLLNAIVAVLPSGEERGEREPEMKVTIAGRRNVGKSTLINTLVETERMIVSEVPGTTRDSVDVRFQLDGKTFVAIDTPGVRKRKSVRQDIEFYGLHRAQRSVRRADVVLLLFDAGQRISQVDKQLCGYIEENYKPCIFVVNKWDLMAGQMPTERWADYLRDTFSTMWHVPIAFITGQTGKNVKKLLNHAQMLFKQSRERISTGELNRLIRRALEHHPPPLYRNRKPKVFYATQHAIGPPAIVLKCTNPKAFSASYRRYLLGVLRDQLAFGEVPIKLYFEKRSRDDERGEAIR